MAANKRVHEHPPAGLLGSVEAARGPAPSQGIALRANGQCQQEEKRMRTWQIHPSTGPSCQGFSEATQAWP